MAEYGKPLKVIFTYKTSWHGRAGAVRPAW